MAKAILEVEMPESCKQCKLGHYYELYDITHCVILREPIPDEGRHLDCPLKPVEKGGGEKMFSISKQDALKIVQAMRMLKLLDEQFFNDIDGAERLMNDLTLFVIGKEDEK